MHVSDEDHLLEFGNLLVPDDVDSTRARSWLDDETEFRMGSHCECNHIRCHRHCLDTLYIPILLYFFLLVTFVFVFIIFFFVFLLVIIIISSLFLRHSKGVTGYSKAH